MLILHANASFAPKGACWAFGVNAALEGVYQIATGQLRSLSEQQLIDCSVSSGNTGCEGGDQNLAFDYIVKNRGLDSEDDYTYDANNEVCWDNAAKRVVASMDSYTKVPPNQEAELAAAVALGPVVVSVEGTAPGFQHYSSGVFAGPCGTQLDHNVALVGLSDAAYIIKNSVRARFVLTCAFYSLWSMAQP